MTGTITRRISLGYGFILLLLLVVTGLGLSTLRHVAQRSETAIRTQNQVFAGIVGLRGSIAAAHASYLRYLLSPVEEALLRRQEQMAQARGGVGRLLTGAPTGDLREGWERASSILVALDQAMAASIEARAGGRAEEAERIRTQRVEPHRAGRTGTSIAS